MARYNPQRILQCHLPYNKHVWPGYSDGIPQTWVFELASCSGSQFLVLSYKTGTISVPRWDSCISRFGAKQRKELLVCRAVSSLASLSARTMLPRQIPCLTLPRFYPLFQMECDGQSDCELCFEALFVHFSPDLRWKFRLIVGIVSSLSLYIPLGLLNVKYVSDMQVVASFV